jgi:hypothetical protein
MPRFSIAWLMIGTAAIAFPCAVVGSVVRNRPIFGLEYCLDTGLAATVPVLVVYFFAFVRRRPLIRFFDVGFLASGWGAVCAYGILCWRTPERMAAPILYYINEIEPRFLNCDLVECDILSLVIRGLILAVPQLGIARVGGMVAERVAVHRKKRDCDRSGATIV